MQYLIIVIYILFTTGGITFMKLGGDSLHLALKDSFSLSIGWKTFIGLSCYLVSFLLWQRLVVKYDISIIVPIVNGIVQVIILLIGHFLFKETLSPVSMVGAALIIIGIVIMGFGTR